MKSNVLDQFIANRQQMLDAANSIDLSIVDTGSKELVESAISDLVYTIEVLKSVQIEIDYNT